MRSRIGAGIALLGTLLAGCGSGGNGQPAAAPSNVPVPVVVGPIGDAGLQGHALWDSWYDLAELGYAEEEYFVSGSAKSHADPAQSAAYTTRILVRRPLDATRFNGTVILDWVNVTAQFENAVDTLEAHQLFHRDGYAYVHVSAQAAGVCCTPLTPQVWDPVRYAALDHPGDDYAFDLFSQIAQLMKTPGEIDPMAGLPVRRVIAVGQSQSGTRLRDYLIEVQPQARVIDAFLIHADGGGVKTYPADPAVPTIQLLSEREATPDAPTVTRNYRLWEIAGAAHQDFWIGVHQVQGQGPRAVGGVQRPASADEDLHVQAGNYGEQVDPGQFVCIVEGTQFPLRYAVMAAIHYLDRWVRDGTPPPQGPRYEFDASGRLARDADGNALGGIRLPPIEVAVASYRSDLCNLGGITIPFTEPQLWQRYPTHADYYCRMQAATARSLAEGFLLPEDAADLMQRVEQSANRWPVAGARDC
ncbi:alpha/beta hydrolase domain-containing protein [Fontimonas sp. SYSU GA230001]|uniref:alpha/beta hydrolase domain-containing protein n=1 Tax=Fontimonas sp. SYSU GA230001 TaxID=3142450 RepID=UPI0032B51BF1